jgi:carbamate kinase
VAAVADFVESTPGAVGIIGAAEEIRSIIEGKSGTRIVPTDSRVIFSLPISTA